MVKLFIKITSKKKWLVIFIKMLLKKESMKIDKECILLRLTMIKMNLLILKLLIQKSWILLVMKNSMILY